MQELFVNVGRSTGATVISASRGTQFALERGDLKNGVFTYAILRVIKGSEKISVSQTEELCEQENVKSPMACRCLRQEMRTKLWIGSCGESWLGWLRITQEEIFVPITDFLIRRADDRIIKKQQDKTNPNWVKGRNSYRIYQHASLS